MSFCPFVILKKLKMIGRFEINIPMIGFKHWEDCVQTSQCLVVIYRILLLTWM